MKILLAVDDSEYSRAAIAEVGKRPWPTRSTVRVLTVIEPFPKMAMEPWYGGRDSLGQVDLELQKRAKNLTRKTIEKIKANGVKAEAIIRSGSPAPEIVAEAGQWGADLIVLGSHGYGAIKRLLLGSVALSVVTHAPCSVEIVRRKETKRSK
jgi:nucleotide-binding universal stress UspA family protein